MQSALDDLSTSKEDALTRRMKALFGLVMAVGLIAAVASAPSYGNVQRIGSYWTTPFAFDSLTGGQVGGETRVYRVCSTETLYVAEVVYLSATADNTVCRSATLATNNNIAGVVVGGTQTGMQVVMSKPDTGTQADTAAFPSGTGNNRVIVLIRGRTWVVSDSVQLASGTQLIPSTSVAGRVKARTTAIDTFYRVFGKLVDSALVKIPTLANINVR